MGIEAPREYKGCMGGPAALTTTIPHEISPSAPGAPYSEPYALPDVGWIKTADGGLTPTPSGAAKERMEDMAGPELRWQWDNMIRPLLGTSKLHPPRSALPPGYDHWEFRASTLSFFPARRSRGGRGTKRASTPRRIKAYRQGRKQNWLQRRKRMRGQ